MKLTIWRVEKCVKQDGSLVATHTRYFESFNDATIYISENIDPSEVYTIEQIDIH